MRRPLALTGLTSMFVLAVCFYFEPQVQVVLAVLSTLGLMAGILVEKIRKEISPVVFFATILLSVTFFNFFCQFAVKPVQEKYCTGVHKVSAVLMEEPQKRSTSSYCDYKLRVKEIDGNKADFRLMLKYKYEIPCDIGDTFEFEAELTNEILEKYYSEKVYVSAVVFSEDGLKTEKCERLPFYGYVVNLRRAIRSSFYSELDFDCAGLASATLLGDNAGISSENAQNIRRAGLSHITVVSGLHLSIVSTLFYKLFRRFPKGRLTGSVISVLVVIAFIFLTGFGKSTIRAAIMLLVIYVSHFFKRRGDSVNSLGLAAIIMIISNPLIVGDIGVLLSFSATFGITAFSGKLERFLKSPLKPVDEVWFKLPNRLLRAIITLFSTTLTAVLGTLPVTVIFFGKVSLVQILSNMAVIPVVPFFMAFAALCSATHFIPAIEIVTDVLAIITEIIGRFIFKVAELFASLPMSYVKADYNFVFYWMIVSLLLFAFIYLVRFQGKGLNLLSSVLSALILFSGVLGYSLSDRNALSVYVSSAKDGQCVLLNCSEGNAVLSCSGRFYNSEKLIPLLDSTYSKNSLMVVASDDNTAQINACNILSSFDYEEILLYDIDENVDDVREYSENVIETQQDYRINLWDKGTLSIIYRDGNVYQYLESFNESVLILPKFGDVLHIPEDMRSADVLITCSLIENMELLTFDTLIANGDEFHRLAVADFYRLRDCNTVLVEDVVNFDIVG